MAYNFSADKRGDLDLQVLHQRLSQFALVECFPVEVSDELFTLGISIPLKAINEPRFEHDLVQLMTYLIVEQGFQVTDLYSGKSVRSEDIPRLQKQITG
jgi:hypothetical protein